MGATPYSLAMMVLFLSTRNSLFYLEHPILASTLSALLFHHSFKAKNYSNLGPMDAAVALNANKVTSTLAFEAAPLHN